MDPDCEATRRAVRARGPACLTIDDLTEGDISTLAWSGTAAHLRSVRSYLARVESGEVEYLAVRGTDGLPVAKGAIDYAEAPSCGSIIQVATHPSLQGLGLASALISAAEERMRRRGVPVARIGVEDHNPRARALYERLGYRPVGRREVSWEAEAPDGRLFLYETVLTDLDKPLAARTAGLHGHGRRKDRRSARP